MSEQGGQRRGEDAHRPEEKETETVEHRVTGDRFRRSQDGERGRRIDVRKEDHGGNARSEERAPQYRQNRSRASVVFGGL